MCVRERVRVSVCVCVCACECVGVGCKLPSVKMGSPGFGQVGVSEGQVTGGNYRISPDSLVGRFLQYSEEQLQILIAKSTAVGRARLVQNYIMKLKLKIYSYNGERPWSSLHCIYIYTCTSYYRTL